MTDPTPLHRILLLGDAASRPAGLERALSRAGYLVLEREDPDSEPPPASPPDIILLNAPVADRALELALAAVGGAAWSGIPRVVLLGETDPDGAVKALAMGADDAVVAPLHLKELVARLGARLRRVPGVEAGRATLWRQELMFDILEELSANLRADAIVETLVRRVGLALELPRCSFLLASPWERYGRVVAVCERPSARDLRVDLYRYPEIREALRSETDGVHPRSGDPPVLRGDPAAVARTWASSPTSGV